MLNQGNISGVHWLNTHTGIKKYSSVQQDDSYDVIVVGAGLCGASTAWHLHKSGLKVALIEARGVAHGATGRNAGFILQGTAERYNRAIEQMGRDKAKLIHSLSIENHHSMKSVIDSEQIECEYRQCGSLQLASSNEEESELIESADLLLEDGFDASLLFGDELGEPYLSAGFQTGILLPEDGEIHPSLFVERIVERLSERGMDIRINSPIMSIDESDGVHLRCNNSTLHAEMAVLCTNAYLPNLLSRYQDIIHPVRGQMLCTTPQKPIFERPIYADHGFDYWRQKPDGRIVLGGWRNLDPEAEVGYSETLNQDIQHNMTEFLKRFPGLEQVSIESRWSGIMGFSQDGLPLIGAVPGQNSVLMGAGFTGPGFGFAWLAGQSLANMILDKEDTFADLCTPRRFV